MNPDITLVLTETGLNDGVHLSLIEFVKHYLAGRIVRVGSGYVHQDGYYWTHAD